MREGLVLSFDDESLRMSHCFNFIQLSPILSPLGIDPIRASLYFKMYSKSPRKVLATELLNWLSLELGLR